MAEQRTQLLALEEERTATTEALLDAKVRVYGSFHVQPTGCSSGVHHASAHARLAIYEKPDHTTLSPAASRLPCVRGRYGVQSEMEALLKEKQEVEKALKAKYAKLEGQMASSESVVTACEVTNLW